MDLAGDDLLWTGDIEKSEEFLRKNLEESVAELRHEPIQGEFFIGKFTYITTGRCDKIIFKRCKLMFEDLFYCKLVGYFGNEMSFPQLFLEGYVMIDEEYVTFTIPSDINAKLLGAIIRFRDFVQYNDTIKYCQHEDYTYTIKPTRFVLLYHEQNINYCRYDACIHIFFSE